MVAERTPAPIRPPIEWQQFGQVPDLVWECESRGISIAVDHLEMRFGQLSGNVHIESIRPRNEGALHWSYGALSDTRYREKVIDDVKKRTAAYVTEQEWGQILFYICNEARRLFRSGNDPAPLEIVDLKARLPQLIKPLVEDMHTTILFARAGTGKSYIAQAIALSAATGRKLLPGVTPSKPVRVLYVNGEGPKADQDARFTRLCAGMGLVATPPEIIHREIHKSFLDEIGEIRIQIERDGIGLVVLDSISAAAGGDLKDDRVVRPFMIQFNTLPCARLAIAHLTKSESTRTDGAATIFGSTFFEALARSVWELRSADEGTTATLPDGGHLTAYRLGLYHRKANESRRHKPFGLQALFTEDADGDTLQVRYKAHDIEGDTQLMPGAENAQRIRAALRNCPAEGLSLEDLQAETGIEKIDTLYRTVKGMPDTEMASGGRGKQGRWRLKAEGERWW